MNIKVAAFSEKSINMIVESIMISEMKIYYMIILREK